MDKFQDETCDVQIIHYDAVNKVRSSIPNEDILLDVSELFKVFGDSTRAKIICALEISELCVCDIAALLNMSISAISHQLRILKQARIVQNRRDGKVIYYSLDDGHIKKLFDTAIEHLSESMGRQG